jgi:hypothetical protein
MSRAGIALSLAFMVGCWSWAAADNPDKANYYPLEVGNKWHYELETTAGVKAKLTNQISKRETIDGVELALLETVTNGSVVASEHLQQTDAGVYRHRFNGSVMTPAFHFLRYPSKAGESWQSDTKTGSQLVKATCRSSEEEVEVPAGKFKTIKVHVDAEVEGNKLTTTYWFANNVGVVQQSFELGGNGFTVRLEKHEKGP